MRLRHSFLACGGLGLDYEAGSASLEAILRGLELRGRSKKSAEPF